jgi:hypothetical protein
MGCARHYQNGRSNSMPPCIVISPLLFWECSHFQTSPYTYPKLQALVSFTPSLHTLFSSLSNLGFTHCYIWIKLYVYFGHNKIREMNDLGRSENLKIRSLPGGWTSLGSKTLSLLFRNKYKKSSKDTPPPPTPFQLRYKRKARFHIHSFMSCCVKCKCPRPKEVPTSGYMRIVRFHIHSFMSCRVNWTWPSVQRYMNRRNMAQWQKSCHARWVEK